MSTAFLDTLAIVSFGNNRYAGPMTVLYMLNLLFLCMFIPESRGPGNNFYLSNLSPSEICMLVVELILLAASLLCQSGSLYD